MNKSILILLAPLLILQARPEAMQLKVGDVYDWTYECLLYKNRYKSIKLSMLEKGVSNEIPADSGVAWKMLVDIVGADAETLELIEFKDKSFRWTKKSESFPIEFQPPNTATKLERWSGYWYGYTTDPVDVDVVAEGLSSYKLYRKYNEETVILRQFGRGTQHTPLPGYLYINGIWTDSLGPVDYRQTNEPYCGWTLRATNGIRNEFKSMVDRTRILRIPNTGDSLCWKKETKQTDGSTTSSLITAKVSSLPDSNGSRRIFSLSEVDDKNQESLCTQIIHYNSYYTSTQLSGNCNQNLIRSSWIISTNDTLISDGTYKGIQNDLYRETGELLWRVRNDSAGTSTWRLLSAPGYTVSAAPQPSRSAEREKLDARSLRILLATDPDATVRWSTLSGQSGQTSLKEYLHSHTKPGVVWMRVKTSDGKVRQGMNLTK